MINIGIDIHKARCVATIKPAGSRKALEQTEFENTAKGIDGFIRHVKARYGRHKARAVCESTANYWYRTHDTFEEHGIDTVLAHPTKTKVIAQAKLKNDKVDSDILADLLNADLVYESFVPYRHYRDMRSLVRTRLGIVHGITRHKNTIHAILAKYDHVRVTADLFSKKSIAQLLRRIELSPVDRLSTDLHIDSIESAQGQLERVEDEIARMAADDGRTRLLMSLPGIGYITALTMISEIVDIERFASAEKLVSYAGISPSHRDSADVHRGGGITGQGSTWLRNAVVEAANTTIRHDERMGKIYDRIAKRRGGNKARVAVARHMLEIAWHLLKKNEEYRTQNRELSERKYKAMQRKARMS